MGYFVNTCLGISYEFAVLVSSLLVKYLHLRGGVNQLLFKDSLKEFGLNLVFDCLICDLVDSCDGLFALLFTEVTFE